MKNTKRRSWTNVSPPLKFASDTKMKNLFEQKKTRRRQTWLSACLVFVVLFATVGSLAFPAITMSRSDTLLECPLQVHQHTDACYADVTDENGQTSRKLICGQADYVVHTHTEACY